MYSAAFIIVLYPIPLLIITASLAANVDLLHLRSSLLVLFNLGSGIIVQLTAHQLELLNNAAYGSDDTSNILLHSTMPLQLLHQQIKWIREIFIAKNDIDTAWIDSHT
jgi:hypothetical protein